MRHVSVLDSEGRGEPEPREVIATVCCEYGDGKGVFVREVLKHGDGTSLSTPKYFVWGLAPATTRELFRAS